MGTRRKYGGRKEGWNTKVWKYKERDQGGGNEDIEIKEVPLTSRWRAAVLRRLTRVTVADLVDGGDPEAVGAEGVESELDVVDVSRHFCPLLPTPELLLLVLLLPRPHHELWQEMDVSLPVVTLDYFLLGSKI